MRQRRIGNTTVGAIGLGGAYWSLPEPPSEEQSIDTIHAALDAGVRLIDTALAYTTTGEPSHNERIVASALRTWSGDTGDVLVATKGGHYRSGPGEWPKDGRPETIREHCETSLRTLGVDAIGLYQLHWPDPGVPIAETMGAFARLREEGKIRLVGVSNFSIGQLEEALSVVPVASVQNHFSPFKRDDEPMVRYCASRGIAYLPYGPLGGPGQAAGIGDSLPAFGKVASGRGVSPQQVVLAWHLAHSPTVIPIPGARRRTSVLDSVKAADLDLTPEELELLDG